MLEQSFEHGTVYLSYVKSGTLTTKSVKIPDVWFGPSRPVHILIDDDFVFVENANTGNVYVYEDGDLQTEGTDILLPDKPKYFYYFGLAHVPGAATTTYVPFFTKNRPRKTMEHIPDINTFELPRTLQHLGYDRTFSYPESVIHLLGDVKATYVDRFKRPIQTRNGQLFPVAMDRVTTTFCDLNTEESTYPIVLSLKDTPFGMADLEPDYTETDKAHFQSLDGFYVEDTPRGGKHKLVPIDSDVFKFQYSDQLEIINEGMVTLYGIQHQWLSNNPRILDISVYESTNQTSVPKARPIHTNIEPYVQALEKQNEKVVSAGKSYAANRYEQETDASYADYMALYILYMQDVYPYRKQLPEEGLPWILEAYGRDVIPWRTKHDTRRNGVPYMVHLANEIIEYNKMKDRKVDNI